MTTLTLYPAQGRDYRTHAEAREAWARGVIFKSALGQEWNVTAVDNFSKFTAVLIRFDNDKRSCYIKLDR